MKSKEIKRLVAKSENDAVEFKRARGGVSADFWPSYSSFANTDGGVIILGVREKDGKREIEGLADTETFFSLVRIGERSGMGLSSLYGTWEKEHFAAPSIVDSYEPDRTKVLVEFESDDSELGVKTLKVGVIDSEVGEKTSEVGEKKAVSEGENAEVKEKTGVSDDVKAASDDVKTGSVHERDQMFTENANKAINPGIITPSNLRPYSKNPIIANFFHQIGRADELGSGVRNLYHYVKLYSGADPIFDERDIFRLTVPLNADYSPEKGLATTQKTTLKTAEKATLQTTLETTLETTLQGTALKIAQLMLSHPEIKIDEIASTVGLTRDGVNYHIRKLKKFVGLRHEGADQAGHWKFVPASEQQENR